MGRRLGQHFLVRKSILERIAEAACPDRADLVLEIGPGKGALTWHLLARADRVIAIEVDQVLVQYLRSKFRDEPRLTVMEGDILKTDLTQWNPITIAGNLPYYIASPIIEKTLALGSGLNQAVFLVQKEVANRIVAKPGTRAYGYLSIQTQLLSTPEILFEVPAAAFHPPPKVDSAVVRLIPIRNPAATNHEAFLKFISQCFCQKRKKIRNNLLTTYDKALVDSIKETSKRAEQLSIDELQSLYAKLHE